MPGFDNISNDESIMYADNASFDGTERGGKLTTNGQLWIGATSSPHVRVGSLTSTDASLTISKGAGTINLEAGSSIPTIFNADSGSATPSSKTITIAGGTNGIDTSASGSTVTLNFDVTEQPAIPTSFSTDSGTVTPSTNQVIFTGNSAAAGTTPVSFSGSGNTATLNVQKSQTSASSNASKVGLSSFNSSQFSVDSNGFVIYTGSSSASGVSSSFFPTTLIAEADNYVLTDSPTVYSEVINSKSVTSTTSPVFFERFVSASLGVTEIPAGSWEFYIYGATSSTTGTNLINFRMNKRVIQTGMTGTFTGAGPTRTFTVTGGTPFVPGDANASVLLASLIETPTQTAWISGYTSPSVVTVTLTDPAFVNIAGTPLSAIYYLLFGADTPDFTDTAVTLYNVSSTQPAFTGLNVTDSLVWAVFATTSAASRTISFYYGGTSHFSYFKTPLVTLLHLTGDTGGQLTATSNNFNILGGPGVTTSGSGSSITINSMVFTDTGAATLVSDNGYFATAAGTYNLPSSPAQGEMITIVCDTAGAVVVDAPSTHLIRIGAVQTSAGGTVTSTSIGDSLTLRYRTSDTTWHATSAVGTWITA